MISSGKFSSFLVGTESILVRCADILLQRGHSVLGIFSSEKLITEWADENEIQVFEPDSSITNVLSQQPFDYLFSIVYPYIIPNDIIALPREGAINFHDGPLPKYAGMNATSWAIINQELTHGITWHEMVAGVDEGAVLKQQFVDIEQRDTALTLNAKCYEAGIGAFSELVDELTNDSTESRKQNLEERTYFAKYKRPPAACTISWNKPAEEISALVRALDYGTYTNPLGLPKLFMGSEILYASKIITQSEISQAAPGTIVAIEHDAIKIETRSKVVSLSNLFTGNGSGLSIPEFVAKYDLTEGVRLPDLEPETAVKLTEINSKITKHEAFWVSRLRSWDPVELPYSIPDKSQIGEHQFVSTAVEIPAGVGIYLANRDDGMEQMDFLVTVYAAFLARVSGNYSYDMGFSHTDLQMDIAGFEPYYATHVPLHVECDPYVTIDEALATLKDWLTQVKKRKTYTRDTVLRYQEMSMVRMHGGQLPWSVIVVQTDNLDDYSPLPGSELNILLSRDGTDCRWVYDSVYPGLEAINSIRPQFDTFLRNIIEDGSQSISDVPILNEIEVHKLVNEWNDTNVDYPRDVCLHELFEEQVERMPDAVAVSFEGEDLTYEEFNRRTNQLAHYLIKIGVGPDVMVGVSMERSLEMVLSLYGILKAGGGYVPLDPEYPEERVAFMLEDTRVPVLLTQERLLASLPDNESHVICLDSDWLTISEECTDNPVGQATAEDIAYVIYTSGSTGRPKGVMNNHRGIVNRILWMQDEYHLTEADRVLQKTPFSFDVSVWEFFWPLLIGASLIVAHPGGHKDSGYLVRLIVEEEITIVHFVPSMLQLFLENKDVGQCTSLKRVICSGEALPYELQNRFFERLDTELHNLYGPTEAAVDVSYWECQRDSNIRTVPIGRAVANTQLYILDRNLSVVPIGVPGELHIGGVQVARGYLNRPELTKEKFILDPFSEDPKARLYKTGDLVRYMPTGAIEYIGRMDFQVKLRGFRIELGEIEAVLNQHSGVREVVVLLREDVPGDKRLAAYIVSQALRTPTSGELREYLKNKLPEYMVPSVIVMMDALPLNPNGKVDIRKLPAPGIKRKSEEQYVAPRNELERMIAGIWQELLQVDKVGVDDNFFEMGGHSLLIERAYRRLSDQLERSFSIADMFGYPTIRMLTQYLSQDLGNGEKSTAQETTTRAKSRREAMALRHQQRRRARRINLDGGN